MEIDWWNTINIMQNLGFILAMALLFHAVYVLGKYQAFTKRVCLSQICPELTDIEAETEDERLRRLVEESAKA